MSVVLLISLLPVYAGADGLREDTHVYEVGTAAELYNAASEISANDYTATIKLKNDITLDNWELKFTAGETTIIGGGNTLFMDQPHNRGIDLTKNAVLNLCLPDKTDSLTLSNGSKDNNLSEAIISLLNNAVLNIYDGALICESRSAATPAGIQLEGKSVLNMYGGVLRNLRSQPLAGGIWLSDSASFNMFGGVIENCENYSQYGDGGGVIITDSASMIMTGGVIRNCNSKYGSGAGICVYPYGDATVSIGKDAEITGNTAGTYGGGILYYNDYMGGGSLTIADGAKIHNNTSDVAGDDIVFVNLLEASMNLGNVGSELVLESDDTVIDGWYDDGTEDDADGNPIRYSSGNAVAVEPGVYTEVLALKAAHGAGITVSFDPNGGDGEMDPLTVGIGVETELPACTFTRDNYVFSGWNTKADGTGTAYPDEGKVTLSSADGGTVTLFAQWNKIITVSISGSTSEKTYSGTIQKNDEYTISISIAGETVDIEELPEGITVLVDPVGVGDTFASGIDAGTYTATVKARLAGSADGYVFGPEGEPCDLRLIIKPAILTVTTMSAARAYNGEPLTAPGKIDGLVSVNGVQETVSFTVTGSQTKIGVSDNTYRLVWNGTAKESNYTIEEDIGLLMVLKKSPPASDPEPAPIPVPVPADLNGEDHFAYVNGYPDGTVRPGASITRAEVAVMFFRLLKDDVRNAELTVENGFIDVSEDQWFNTAVSTLAKMGIITGYPDGTFRPGQTITRAEFAALAARFDKSADPPDAGFSDISGHWAYDEITKAAANGWVDGYPDGSFRPDRTISRAEAMALMNRVLNRDPADITDLLEGMLIWPDNADTSAWYYIDVQEATNGHKYERVTKPTEKWTALEVSRDWTQI